MPSTATRLATHLLNAEFNDTHKEKLLYSIQYKNGWLAASDLFDMFAQSIKF